MTDRRFDWGQAPAVDPYAAELARRKQQEAAAAYLTAPANPDAAGKANMLARQTGLPPTVVDGDLAGVERQAQVVGLRSLMDRYPAIGSFVSNPRNAAVVGSDVNTLGHSSKLWTQALAAPPTLLTTMKPDSGDASYMGASARAGLNNMGGVFYSGLSSGVDLHNAVKMMPEGDFLGSVLGLIDLTPLGKYINAPKVITRQLADEQYGAGQAQFQRLAPDQQKFADLRYATLDSGKAAYLSPTRVAGDVVNSLPTMAALAVTAYLTRGASIRAEAGALAAGMTESEAAAIGVKAAAATAARVGAASEGAVGYHQQKLQTRAQILEMPFDKLEGSPAYQQLIAGGDTPIVAREKLAEQAGEKAGSIAGIVDAATNLVSGPVLGKIIGEGGSLIPRVAKGFATEGAQEAVQSAGEQVGGNLAAQEADPHQALFDGVLENTIQGLVVGGFSGAPTAAVFGRAHHEQVQAARDQITGDALGKAMDAAADNPVRARDPEAFRQFVELHTHGTPIESMFVPAEAVATYFQSQDQDYHEDPFWSQFASQIDEGRVTGGDVIIPTDQAAAHLAGTPAWEALRQEVRTSPGGLSMTEAKAVEKRRGEIMKNLGEKMAEHDVAAQQAGEPHRRIYDEMRAKLVNAGFTAEASHSTALLTAQAMVARADRLGKPLVGDEAKAIEVNRVLPENLAPIVAAAPGSVALKNVIGVMRKGLGEKSSSKLYGPTLLEWIAKQGGVEDKGGDIKSMGGDTWHKGKPGMRKLIRESSGKQGSMLGADGQQNTNSPDELAVRAQEAGYFPPGERPSVNDLLDAIGAELRGKKHFAEDHSTGADQARATAEDLRQLLDEADLDPATATEAQIKKAIDAYREKQEGDFQHGEQSAASITGEEIAPAATPVPELRKAARAWYDEHLKGHSFPSDALGKDVQFAGSRKAFSSSADPRKLRAFAALPELIKNGKLINSMPPRDPQIETSTKAYHYLEGPVSIGDQTYTVGVTVREDAAGNLYYNHSMQEGAPKDPEDTASKAGPGVEGRPLRQDIAQNTDNINITMRQDGGKGARGQITFRDGRSIIDLFQAANMSTFVHEFGHHLLEQLRQDALATVGTDGNEKARQTFADWEAVKAWFKANGHPVEGEVIPVEAHELFARGFERFTMEGKAPSSALKRVFETMKRWMLQVYKTVDSLRSPITPEIRDVMQRLLATDEEIEAAREQQKISSLFTDAAMAGMSEAEFAEYEKAAQDARDSAHDALLYKTMATIREARTKAWKQEETSVRDEKAAEIDRRPEFRALDLLRTGRMRAEPGMQPSPAKLDRAWLVENYGEGILSALPKGVPPLYTDQGATHADEIAERVGFKSGDEMIRTLVSVEERKGQMREAGDERSVRGALIDEATQTEMRARHGDALNDGSIEDEALAAVHNDKQGAVIASELRALARQRGTAETPTPYALAREWARAKIAAGTVNEMTSGRAIQQYARAAAKAGKAAELAMAKNDVDETFRQKQAQMLNNALVSEAGAVREKLETAISRLSRFGRKRTMESMDQEYLEQIHELLEQVEFKDRSQRSIARQQSFEAWANARQAEGFDVVVPPSFAASLGTVHWSQLTVDKLLGLDDTVQQIAHIGRLKQKLLDGQEERHFADMVADGLASTNGMAHKPPVSGFLDPSQPAKLRSFILNIDAMMLKMETVFGWLDQGKPNGFYTRAIFQRFVDAQDDRRVRLKDMKAKLDEIRTRVPEAIRKTWGDKVEIGLIDQTTGLPAVMTRDKLIMMALNLGNESSAWKLARGYGWNEQAILREIGIHLKPEEWTMVQELWDQIGTLWPDIAKLERRINGVEPDKVEARPVHTPFGDLKGGYFPVVYDPSRNLEVEKSAADDSDALFSKGYRRATTRAGSTHERTGFYAPILLSFSVIDRHVGEVIHDITHREAVMDANRFLNDTRIVNDIRETLGTEIQKQIQPWLRHIANEWASDAAGTVGAEKFFKNLRTNATFVGIGFRVSTILQQAVGLFNTNETLGARWVASGIGRFAQHPIEATRMVLETSKEVASRMETMDRDINDAVKAEHSKFGFISEAKLFAFQLIGYSDRFVSVVSWIGGYNRGLSEGMTEEQAVAYADKIVRQSQGGGAAKDLAAIQRGKGTAGEASKLITMFYSYMSAFYQRQRTLGRDYNEAIRTRSISDMPGLLARTMWLYFFPALASELIGNGPPKCEDAECWTKWTGKTIGMAALGPIPVVRDIAGGLASGFGYDFSPASGLGRTVVAVGKDVANLFEGKETKHATKDALEAVGYATGKVPGQAATATQFLVDVSHGDQHPETFGQWYNGLTKGKTDPKAR